MPISKINTSGIADNAVISSKIAQDIVIAEDIANNAVTVNELASDVKQVIGDDVKIINTKSDDNRSYHVSSEKIKKILGFETKYSVKDAVLDLKNAFEKKLLTNTFNDELFFNIKRMNNINLK